MAKEIFKSENKEEIIDYVKSDLLACRHIHPKWYEDRDVALAMVWTWGQNVDLLSRQFRSDTEIIKTAILTTPTALRYACREIRDSLEFRKLAYRKAGHCFLVDPIAIAVFAEYDKMLLRNTLKASQVAEHPIYKRFQKIYECELGLYDALEIEKELIGRRAIFINSLLKTQQCLPYEDLEELALQC